MDESIKTQRDVVACLYNSQSNFHDSVVEISENYGWEIPYTLLVLSESMDNLRTCED